jgi:hypothetical protein
MANELAGGIPCGLRITGITTAGREVGAKVDPHRAPYIGKTNWVHIVNVGANDLRVFWSKKDFDDNANYTTVPTGAVLGRNPLSLPVSLEDRQQPHSQPLLWLKSAAATTDVEIVFLHRRS